MEMEALLRTAPDIALVTIKEKALCFNMLT